MSVKATTAPCVQRSLLMSVAHCRTLKLVQFLTMKLTQISAVLRKHMKLSCNDDDEDVCSHNPAATLCQHHHTTHGPRPRFPDTAHEPAKTNTSNKKRCVGDHNA